MNKRIATVIAAGLLSASTFSLAETPQNVILIIGDGMDDQQISIARNYLVGSQGRLTLDAMPVRSTAQVLTVDNDDPNKPVYVADSANSATSLATGVITSRGRIATTAKTDQSITTIIEMAQQAGLKTGIVSTASVTDATPASFIAHIDKRFCEDPSMMIDGLMHGRFPIECESYTKANGRSGSISEQLAASNVDVILGGGMQHFDIAAEASDKTVLQQAVDNGFNIVTSVAELENANNDSKLLGLFSPSTMPTLMRGENGRIAEAPEKSVMNHIYKYLGEITPPPVMICEDNPKFASMPTMKQMTDAAISHLDSNQGFFLMIESASIDKASHGRNACGSIGEVQQLNAALDSALAYAETSPNTLIIVTADHGQAAQMIPEVSLFSNAAYGGLPAATPGLIARIKTPEGSIMGVNYATNESFAEEHTGVNVPVFANIVGQDVIAPMITQPDIFTITANHLGLK
ncbi:Alkaline phosphatase [Sinobacterium norvegicum]|uniref:Alkaline phosphatase n=1 Tax=Sinobacterium norvegicum TaxID=1641715 RepID=A0ABM9AJH4_9GAMM|nr:alkaline phosphatase [Sinobacterium norvegicum]CAH0993388.1 Alkaline phosphatase [Sinobacterium norvegicum]